jgi:hypothetical protein
MAFHRRFFQICLGLDHPVFTSLDFPKLNYFQSNFISLASKPQPGGAGPCIYVPQLYPQAPGSLFVAFCDSQGQGRVILTRLNTRNGNVICEG